MPQEPLPSFKEMMPCSQQQKRQDPVSEEKSSKRPIQEIAKGEQPAAKRPSPNSENSNNKGCAPANAASAVMQVKQLRLPVPCPTPTTFTPNILRAIENKQLLGITKTRLLREATSFYWGLCPRPTHDEYVAMATALCDKFPQLRDKMPPQGKYWVSLLATPLMLLVADCSSLSRFSCL